MLELSAIISAGVARYEARYAPPLADVAELETTPNITLDENRQRALCLSCALPDCVDITDSRCPIRQAQRALWRANR